MAATLNRQIRLKSRPTGIPQAEHFEIADAPLPQLADRQFRVRNEFLSVDPAMRGWVSTVANYSTPVGLGEVMRSFAAGTVVASRHPDYAEGEKVMGMFGWQEFAVSDGASITRRVKEVDLPLSLSLGVLGLNGVTAFFWTARSGFAPTGRYGRRLNCGRRGGIDGRSDRETDGLPNGWNHRWADQDKALPRRFWI
jgi:NADPH-dependent curcumin reductase CurA